MSEKQFVLYEHKGDYYILKNPRLHLDFIEMLGDALTSEEIVEELNQLNDKVVELAEKNEQLKNYFKKRAECSNFQINKLKEEIAELQEDNVDTIVELSKENEQLKAKVKRLQDIATRTEAEKEEYADLYNECRRLKLSDEAIKQAYADLNRREREKHSQGNATYTAKMNWNEVIY